MNSKCRTCLSESSTYYQLFDYAENDCKILEMLDCIVPQIDIKSTPQFSTLVCSICLEKLLISYEFQQLCIKSNKNLHELNAAVTGTHLKTEKILDSLKTEPDQALNIKIEEDIVIESELNAQKKSVNEWTGICQAQLSLDILKHEEDADTEDNSLRTFPTLKSPYREKGSEGESSLYAHNSAIKDEELIENNGQTQISEQQNALESSSKLKAATKQCEKLDNNLNNESETSYGQGEKEVPVSIDTGSANIKQATKKTANKNVFGCKVCGKVFARSWGLERHNMVHSLARPYECEICKYRFSDEKFFKGHLFQHKSEGEQDINQSPQDGHKCQVCQRNFISIKQLAKHLKNKHPEVSKHKCDYCSRMFILHDSLLKHINYRHKSDKNLLCQICKKVFGNAYKLKDHMLIHKTCLCPHCGKTFHGASNLKQHMERHKGLLKYQCPDCPKRFNCKSDMFKHVSSHSNVKPYACDVCGSLFTRKYTMERHKILHTAERSYKCDQCNMAFKLDSHLKRHKRTHTGEKPYKCKYCERAYALSGDLTKHLRTHVGINIYNCDQCPMAFKYQAELRQHESQHYKMGQTLPQKTQLN